MARPPRARPAVEADLRDIPHMRNALSDDPVADLLRWDVINRRADRLLDELWPLLPRAVQAAANIRAETALHP